MELTDIRVRGEGPGADDVLMASDLKSYSRHLF